MQVLVENGVRFNEGQVALKEHFGLRLRLKGFRESGQALCERMTVFASSIRREEMCIIFLLFDFSLCRISNTR